MTKEELVKMRWALNEIADDRARDALAFDGKAFNGRTVAEYFGNQGAAIAALAKMVGILVESVIPEPPQ